MKTSKVNLVMYYERDCGYAALKEAEMDLLKVRNVIEKSVQIDSIEAVPGVEANRESDHVYKMNAKCIVEGEEAEVNHWIDEAFKDKDVELIVYVD